MSNSIYYTVYKVQNQVNGKIYIGCHKTKDLNDNYMGSGKYLKHSIQKHGIDKFTKEILFVYDNPEEMFAKEKELVTEEFIAEENTYNLKIGGEGGFDYLNNKKTFNNPTHSKAHMKMMNSLAVEAFKNSKELSEKRKIMAAETMKRCHAEGKIRYDTMTGKKHSDEAKQKMSEAKKNAPIIKCPHCGLQSNNRGNMKRWHFNNCKTIARYNQW